MNNPLQYASQKHATAFKGIVAWLKTDPTLKRIVKVWRAFEGQDDDETPWTSDDDVGVRIIPELGPSSPVAFTGQGQRVWSRPLDITIQGFVSGRAATESMQLADAISQRMHPPVLETLQAQRTLMNTWGVMEILETQPLTTKALDSSIGTMGEARYRLEMWIDG